ncbi:MAG: ABC transporter [Acidobacteria bacterium]|nr:MAG: ABC transporter [Acidobacteriota bacterium]
MSPDSTFLEVSHLRKTFGPQIAIDDISFSVRRGEILGYLGPNGAGKSTTLKILAGLLTPDSGNVKIGEINLQQNPIEAKKRMGFVPETGALYEKLTPLEYLEMVGQLYRVEVSEIRRKSHEFLGYFDLAEQRDVRMTSFSKGMKQKVVLSAALLHNPDLLLLDEPLNGLDANTVLMFKGVMRRLADLGKTIIYSSHILEVVEKLCDRIAIIHRGQIVAEGSIRQLREMTQSPSLELIFKELTKAKAVEDKIEAFAKAITNGRELTALPDQAEKQHEP